MKTNFLSLVNTKESVSMSKSKNILDLKQISPAPATLIPACMRKRPFGRPAHVNTMARATTPLVHARTVRQSELVRSARF